MDKLNGKQLLESVRAQISEETVLKALRRVEREGKQVFSYFYRI